MGLYEEKVHSKRLFSTFRLSFKRIGLIVFSLGTFLSSNIFETSYDKTDGRKIILYDNVFDLNLTMRQGR